MGRVEYYALDSRVLAVAVEGEVQDWAAYVGAVPGNNHDRELHIVAHSGTKLPRAVAELLFPHWKKEYKLRWRD